MVVGSCINGFRSQEENPLNEDLLTNFLDSERETKETPFTRKFYLQFNKILIVIKVFVRIQLRLY